METWNNKINGNDTFQDIYQNFFDLYNQGQNPLEISKQIQDECAEMFEDYDDRNQGILDTANFKTCLMKVKLDLSVGEINRLCRYIDKNPDGTIDYYRFLDTVSKISKESKEGEVFRDLQDFTERLANYLK